MKRLTIAMLCALVFVPAVRAEYTTNDWQTAQEQWKAARAAWTNEMAKAAAAGLVPARKTRKAETAAKVLPKAQRSFFENRRIAVSRDTETLPGYVITTWHRNGKPDTLAPAVVTNRLQNIVGKEQRNPIQALADEYKAAAEEWRETATNLTARVERANAVLDEKRAEYVSKRDAATLPSTKAIYQAFIDAIDRIKAKMNAED